MRYLLALVILLQAPAVFAIDGGVVSNGGDSIAGDFVNQAYVVAKILRVNKVIGVDSDSFLTAVQSTKVISRDQLFLADNNREVDAINYPQLKLIEVSRTRWQAKRTDSKTTLMLVAHEYFGIMGLNDSSYQISHQLFAIQGEPLMVFKCKNIFQGVLTGSKDALYNSNFDVQLFFYKDSLLRGELIDDRGNINEDAVVNMSMLAPRFKDGNMELPLLFYVGLPMIHKMIQFPMVITDPGKVVPITASYWRIMGMDETPEIKTADCTGESMIQTEEEKQTFQAHP